MNLPLRYVLMNHLRYVQCVVSLSQKFLNTDVVLITIEGICIQFVINCFELLKLSPVAKIIGGSRTDIYGTACGLQIMISFYTGRNVTTLSSVVCLPVAIQLPNESLLRRWKIPLPVKTSTRNPQTFPIISED